MLRPCRLDFRSLFAKFTLCFRLFVPLVSHFSTINCWRVTAAKTLMPITSRDPLRQCMGTIKAPSPMSTTQQIQNRKAEKK